jgi:ABC-2 type transport system permease protein
MIRFGEMSMAAVLQLLVTLLVFFVGASAVTRERENGTLALLLCQGIPFGAVLAGKTLGILAIVGSWLFPALVASTLFLALATDLAVDAEIAGRAALLFGSYTLFFVVCAAAPILVSARSRTSRGALTTLVGAWVLFWIALPRGLSTLGETLHPSPSRAEFEAALEHDVRLVGDSHNPDDPYFRALKEDFLAEHGSSDLSELPLNYKGVVMLEAEKATTEVFRRHYRGLLETRKRQHELARWAAFLDPYLAIRELSMAIAGSDADHFEDFYRQAEEFRFDLVQELNRLHSEEISFDRDVYVRPESGPPSRERIPREHFRDLPAFEYRAPGIGFALSGHISALGALALFVPLTLLAAWRIAGRVEVA